jgi:hypothetical protein
MNNKTLQKLFIYLFIYLSSLWLNMKLVLIFAFEIPYFHNAPPPIFGAFHLTLKLAKP